jgi:hypothetical protein
MIKHVSKSIRTLVAVTSSGKARENEGVFGKIADPLAREKRKTQIQLVVIIKTFFRSPLHVTKLSHHYDSARIEEHVGEEKTFLSFCSRKKLSTRSRTLREIISYRLLLPTKFA